MMSACMFIINSFLIFLTRFFTPTIAALKGRCKLYLLVLSNGGYDGLGKIREGEMDLAANYMGFEQY